MAHEKLGAAFSLIEQSGIQVASEAKEKLEAYVRLVQKWNDALGLVSPGDVKFLIERHVVDALSLVPFVAHYAGRTGSLLDIGSGGGFPAVPIKCVLGNVRCRLMERNSRKISFLHRVVASLELSSVEVAHGSFPDQAGVVTESVITARAVEKPERLGPAVIHHIPNKGVFLCQTDPRAWRIPAMFHVEHVNDPWWESGLRRGELYLITKRQI